MNNLKAQNIEDHAEREKADGKSGYLRGKRVLLAEDHPLNVEIVRNMLEQVGVEMDWACDGCKAVEMVCAKEPGYYAAVLMDVRMPKMTGLEACRALRGTGRPDLKAMPVIALTANGLSTEMQLAAQAGMTAYLMKPITPQRLFALLEELVGQTS